MAPRYAASPDQIEIVSILRVYARALPKLVVLSGLAAAVTFGILTTVAPRYQAEAELKIVAKGASGPFADSNESADSLSGRMDREAINTHVKALQSPNLASMIATDFKLAGKPEFNTALGPVDTYDANLRMVGLSGPRAGETEQDRTLANYYRQLEVFSAKESRVISIHFTSVDPHLAAEIANGIAEKYRSELASSGVTEIGDVQQVLDAKIKKLVVEVEAAEAEVERYRGEVNLFRGAQNTSLNDQQLGDLTSELTRAKTQRSEAEARARSARELLKAGSADAAQDVQKSPLIQNLVQQRVGLERQISELSATLLPGHPRMRQLNADLSGLKSQITAETNKIVGALEREAKVAVLREDSIKSSLDEIKVRVAGKGPEEARLRQFDAIARSKRNELDKLQAQYESNRKRVDSRAVPVEAEIITKARTPSLPSGPRKGSISALVAVAAFLLGTAGVLATALFSGARREVPVRVTRRKETESAAIEPKLPSVQHADHTDVVRPDVQLNAALAPANVQVPETPPIANEPPRRRHGSVDSLADRLGALAPRWGGQRIMVLSETDGGDASGFAVVLAETLASQGADVVLVDWSGPDYSIGTDIGVEGDSGLDEMLDGSATFDSILNKVPGSAIQYVWRGVGLEDIDEIDADTLGLALDALDESYMHVIFTGPRSDLRTLFEVIEGRIDAAVVVDDGRAFTAEENDHDTQRLLDFDVTEIDINHIDPSATEPGIKESQMLRREASIMRDATLRAS